MGLACVKELPPEQAKHLHSSKFASSKKGRSETRGGRASAMFTRKNIGLPCEFGLEAGLQALSPLESFVSDNSDLAWFMLTSFGLSSADLASLSAACRFFHQPAWVTECGSLSIPEAAAYSRCRAHKSFQGLTVEQQIRHCMRQSHSWKGLLSAFERHDRNGPHIATSLTNDENILAEVNVNGQLTLGRIRKRAFGDGSEWLVDQMNLPASHLATFRAVQVAVGHDHVVVVNHLGEVFTFGEDGFGQCGHGSGPHGRVTELKAVDLLAHEFVVEVAAGDGFSLALTATGHVYSWGRSECLGLGPQLVGCIPRPRIVASLPPGGIVKIAAGPTYALALEGRRGRGALWAWGQPAGKTLLSLGGCKDCPRSAQLWPRRLPYFGNLGIRAKRISAGRSHAAFLDAHGRVYTWRFVEECSAPSWSAPIPHLALSKPSLALDGERMVQVFAGPNLTTGAKNAQGQMFIVKEGEGGRSLWQEPGGNQESGLSIIPSSREWFLSSPSGIARLDIQS